MTMKPTPSAVIHSRRREKERERGESERTVWQCGEHGLNGQFSGLAAAASTMYE